jgi:hypothetical protein
MQTPRTVSTHSAGTWIVALEVAGIAQVLQLGHQAGQVQLAVWLALRGAAQGAQVLQQLQGQRQAISVGGWRVALA